jgi:hypothetical protein
MDRSDLGSYGSVWPWLIWISLTLAHMDRSVLGSYGSVWPWLIWISLTLAHMDRSALGSYGSVCPWLIWIGLTLAHMDRSDLGWDNNYKQLMCASDVELDIFLTSQFIQSPILYNPTCFEMEGPMCSVVISKQIKERNFPLTGRATTTHVLHNPHRMSHKFVTLGNLASD